MSGACSTTPWLLTAEVLAWAALLHLAVGIPLGWLLARGRFPGRELLDALVTVPLVFPPVVLGYFLLLLLGQQGVLTGALPEALRPEIVFRTPGLVIAAFVAGLPLMVKPVQAAFKEVPPALIETAATLRAAPMDRFFAIELPLARRGLAAGLTLAVGRGLGEIGISLMLGGNIVGRTETVSLAIYNHVTDGNFACANELSLLLAGLAAVAFFLVKRFGAL
ncbi:MAG: ABC transporter permease subunit [Tepidimonas sp.]|uniref:molybdate ABC transporter permease subunit n=1 Tax=Tepidimonas sp. TaxID=2002775 RepID=UPI00259F5AF5|nr:ABC transporter permease subunit [Tepidimonas sp.]MDM7457097.1 ABC transporter permease subunit [Tepidimonas sp.]